MTAAAVSCPLMESSRPNIQKKDWVIAITALIRASATQQTMYSATLILFKFILIAECWLQISIPHEHFRHISWPGIHLSESYMEEAYDQALFCWWIRTFDNWAYWDHPRDCSPLAWMSLFPRYLLSYTQGPATSNAVIIQRGSSPCVCGTSPWPPTLLCHLSLMLSYRISNYLWFNHNFNPSSHLEASSLQFLTSLLDPPYAVCGILSLQKGSGLVSL